MRPDTPSPQFESLLKDSDLLDELRERVAAGKLPLMQQFGISADAIESRIEKTVKKAGKKRGKKVTKK